MVQSLFDALASIAHETIFSGAWIKAVASVISALAWPSVAIIVLLVLRRSLSQVVVAIGSRISESRSGTMALGSLFSLSWTSTLDAAMQQLGDVPVQSSLEGASETEAIVASNDPGDLAAAAYLAVKRAILELDQRAPSMASLATTTTVQLAGTLADTGRISQELLGALQVLDDLFQSLPFASRNDAITSAISFARFANAIIARLPK